MSIASINRLKGHLMFLFNSQVNPQNLKTDIAAFMSIIEVGGMIPDSRKLNDPNDVDGYTAIAAAYMECDEEGRNIIAQTLYALQAQLYGPPMGPEPPTGNVVVIEM